MKENILAIDIGGSKFMVGFVSRQGEIYYRERYEWQELTPEGVVGEIVLKVQSLLERFPQYSPTIIGVTVPALADPEEGIWVEASFSGIKNLPLAGILEQKFALPVYLDNDGQACALAEKYFGACKDTEYFLYVTVSNGVGGAIFAGGSLYYGASGNAGEIGHFVVVENGRQCKCGTKGCLEMYAAGPGVVKTYEELGGSVQIDGQPASAQLIAGQAAKGEAIALQTFDLEGQYLGKVIGAACNLLNPEKVILGGGISLAFDYFKESLVKTVQQNIYCQANRILVIEPTTLKYDGGLLGAAAVAVQRLNKLGTDPNREKAK